MTDLLPTQFVCTCNLCLRHRQLAAELRGFEEVSPAGMPVRLVPRVNASTQAPPRSC